MINSAQQSDNSRQMGDDSDNDIETDEKQGRRAQQGSARMNDGKPQEKERQDANNGEIKRDIAVRLRRKNALTLPAPIQALGR